MIKRGRPRRLGVNDWQTNIRVNGKLIPEYNLWMNMLGRVHGKNNPSYAECQICPEWYSMTAFVNDVSTLPNYEQALTEGWCLDKDLLVKGNNEYRLDRCCFVPNEINTLVVNCKTARGKYPVGVCLNKQRGKFIAQLSVHGKVKGLGYFLTVDEAFVAYKTAKEAHVKSIAEQWRPHIDKRVYEALQLWEVNLID